VLLRQGATQRESDAASRRLGRTARERVLLVRPVALARGAGARLRSMSAATEDPGLSGCVPFRWSCQRCARCCSGGAGFVWVEPHEIDDMAAVLAMEPGAFRERYVRSAIDPRSGEARLSLREDGRGEGGRCALLVGASECSVYAARPVHCRNYPYWDSVLGDPRAFEAARATCPGIAVIPAEELRTRAFAALRDFYAACDRGATAATECCLRRCPDELYATGLEADHVASARGGAALETRGGAAAERAPDRELGCELGAARPLGCRMSAAEPRSAEQALLRLRALERELGYPAAYGRLVALLRARGDGGDGGSESSGESSSGRGSDLERVASKSSS
jgi:Fe-S-cluster containining protein